MIQWAYMIRRISGRTVLAGSLVLGHGAVFGQIVTDEVPAAAKPAAELGGNTEQKVAAPDEIGEVVEPDAASQLGGGTGTKTLAGDNSEAVVSADRSRQAMILVVGSGGSEEYRAVFATWAARWKDAAARANAELVVIGGTKPVANSEAAAIEPTPAEPAADSVSPAENCVSDCSTVELTVTAAAQDSESKDSALSQLTEAISRLAIVETSEPLWIVYIGHGTFDGRRASWNLEGPDISELQLAELLQPTRRPLAAVICSSCSSPFVNALSGPKRVIITATKDGSEIQYSRFGDAMSIGISTLDSDINRDGQSSLLEAWLFASRRTADFYATEGRLATEHALLDDNGDKLGTRAEAFEGDRIKAEVTNADQLDGKLAARWALVRSELENSLTTAQREQRDVLEEQLAALRLRKSLMDEAEYLNELESILRPLAELYQSAAVEPSP